MELLCVRLSVCLCHSVNVLCALSLSCPEFGEKVLLWLVLRGEIV